MITRRTIWEWSEVDAMSL